MTDLTLTRRGELKRRLEERRQALREDIRDALIAADEQPYIDLAGRVHDSGEESVADLLVDLNIALIDRHLRELRGVEQALIRIGTDVYGRCVNCANEIDYPRLRSYPSAERCIECQAVHEHVFFHEETPRL